VLIPAIDIQGGRVVQLVQGERLALAFDDLDRWLRRFAAFPLVQVIDLDAAKGHGSNDDLIRRSCAALGCRVGGGIRSIERARSILELGAHEVILGSALFDGPRVNAAFAAEAAQAIGRDRLVAAVDCRNGKVTLRGWREVIDLTPVQAVRELEPYVGAFLCTIVEGEGLMQGIDMTAILAVKDATSLRVTAAGGIRGPSEVAELDRVGVDAVVGMALYSGKFDQDGEGG
jgi:phosphoribosylformimino-5-aminoimidazole carboxamide ribotide isomerase